MKTSFVMEPKQFLSFAFVLAVVLSAIAFFLTLLSINAVNLPFRDDWTAILMFLNSWADAQDPLSKFNLILENQYDHRIAWIRLVSLAVYKILGIVDIKVIIFIGTFALFLILACIWLGNTRINGSNIREKLFWFAPIVLFLLQPMYSESWFQAMSSVSSFYAIAFGVIALCILHRTGKEPWFWVLAAFPFVVMGFFSHREGIAFLIAGIALLFFQKKWLKLSVWTILVFLAILFYQNYNTNHSMNGIYSVEFSFNKLSASVIYFFSFVGNNFGINTGSGYFQKMPHLIQAILTALPVIAGIALTGCLAWITVKRYDRINPFVASLAIGVLIICLGASLYRDSGSNPAEALVSRYRSVTIFLVIVIYIAFMELIQNPQIRKWVWRGFFAFSLIFCAGAYALKLKPIREHRNELVNSFRTYQKTGKGLIPVEWAPDNPEPILKESIRKGVWRIPEKY